jgi:Ca2+-binding EF-hand superfamily protein/diadenosine tetraphosphatase ApaH/serine/threonine PP2A family protein phosphatase
VVAGNFDGNNCSHNNFSGILVAGMCLAYLDHDRNASPTLCEEMTTSFRVIQALESKDEVQRLRMAQILHDLHELAQSNRKLRRHSTVKRLWKYVSRPFQQDLEAEAKPAEDQSGTRLDFDKLSPAKAKELIHQICKDKTKNRLSAANLLELLEVSEHVLCQDATLLHLEDASTVSIVGDLHGSLPSLRQVLDLLWTSLDDEDSVIVFDGDFVDRGEESLEVMCVLLLLKLAYPKKVYLLRGNHEDVLISSAYGFQDELIRKYGVGRSELVFDAFNAVFCALPICAVTKTAAILHGGLPSRDFDLKHVEEISTEARCRVKTAVNDSTDPIAQLIQGILWSDPSPNRYGIHFNKTRTIGVTFGPDVVRDFLNRHGLLYLIRGHEVAEQGTSLINCGDGRSVLTVFSHSEYPNGEGNNLGAFIKLHSDGKYELVKFSKKDRTTADHVSCRRTKALAAEDPYVQSLRTLISSSKHKLEKSFQMAAPFGVISPEEWAEVMADTLDLPEIPWTSLIPSLVPSDQVAKENDPVDWKEFLKLYSSPNDKNASLCQDSNIGKEILSANHEIMVTVFKFLDSDNNGIVNAKEFSTGIALLNKRLPQDRQLNAETLFAHMDKDGNGTIDLQEFEEVFKVM